MRILLNTKGEELRDLLEGLLSGMGSSCCVEEALVEDFPPFLDQDLPRSLSEESKMERAPITDFTDIIRLIQGGEGGVCSKGCE